MQVRNTDPPVRLTGRHVTVTEAMEDYVRRRLATLHLDYPRILEIHAILSLEKFRHRVDIILRCNWHITIKTSAETDDMYASIDRAIDRTARQMRKYLRKGDSTGDRRYNIEYIMERSLVLPS
jgi:putative sigma-54 modulation protein